MSRLRVVATCALAILWTTATWAESLQRTKPEEVGLSSERLGKIGNVFKQDIEQGKIPGVVVMIARKGKLAYAESFGVQNQDKRVPMTNVRSFAPIQ